MEPISGDSILTVTSDSCTLNECKPTSALKCRHLPVREHRQVLWRLVVFEMRVLRTIDFQSRVSNGRIYLL
jgi:hypothetical protein